MGSVSMTLVRNFSSQFSLRGPQFEILMPQVQGKFTNLKVFDRLIIFNTRFALKKYLKGLRKNFILFFSISSYFMPRLMQPITYIINHLYIL